MFQGRQPRPEEPGQRTGHVQRNGQKPLAMAGQAGEPLTWPPRGRWSRTVPESSEGRLLANQLPTKSNPYLARRV
ncbi:hypothetical protein XarjCFBP7653_19810 [Xanthomonas arboricola]|nr:hypothetical protein XaCFBP7622_04710 [Xanthomonas arboricola]PPT34765.1 hypothetical protein XarjCFBP7653_19810 [Xanthomonas arboricola]